MSNVTRSTRKLKEVDSNSKGGNIGGKGSSVSGSSNSDTTGLRRSARETPVKKQRTPSPVSTRKSERFEKRTPLSPPTMRKSERVEKQRMPSPLRRSERGENHLSISSSDSRKSEKGLDLLENRNKQESTVNSEKCTKINTIDRSRDEKNDTRSVHTVSRRKRMDARSYYKALLTPQPKKTRESDPSKRLKEHDEASQGDPVHMGSSSFEEDVAEDIVRNAEEVGEKDAGEVEDRDAEEYCDDLRNLEARRSKNIREMELSHSSRKRKKFEDEFHECTYGDSSPVSKRSTLEPSPGVPAQEAVIDAEKVQLDGSTRDGILKVPMVSTSEGRSVSDNQCLENDFILGTPKKKKKLDEIDSDALMTSANEEIYSSADPIPSSPSESKRTTSLERCDACSKRQRFEVDSQKCLMCSHNNEENQNSWNDSSLEEVREKRSIFKNLDNGLMPTHCTIKDGNQTKGDHIDRSLQEDVHRSEPLSDVERKNMHGQAYVHTKGRISNPLEEEGGELMSTSCKGLSEVCCNKMQAKESPLDIQTEYDHNACAICKLGGELLCCNGKGCKRNYHLHCLGLPREIVPVGLWHCFQCIKRKIQFGMHSVSEGVESICGVREEEVSDCEGSRKQKHYLVKYKGLAHVHNRWVPEHQLLLESPLLVARFNKKQALKWKSEWTKPQRLVKKRFLTFPKQKGETFSDCQCEWLKWTSLSYEHGTWELENAPFLWSNEAMELKRDYESRLEKALSATNPSFVKLLEERKNTAHKQSKLPSLNTCGLDNDHLNFVNKLREYWHKSQNAVVAEDQERILKVVLFILSMHSDVCRPFLVISTSDAISVWEAEFMRSAPSVNVVAYNGNKVVRETIRALEFYEDGGCVMLQVLLSPIDAIIEDLDALEFIGWEAIIVDECQRPRVSSHYEQIKKLTSGFRLLLLSGPIKDSSAEYLNHLSFIETGDISLKTDSGDTISNLKKRFARFVVCEQKLECSKFVEYWIPVRLSNVQLEQYCATLLSKSMALCSCSKNDPVGALRDILISVRKTCDHPYLVNQSLQSLLRKDLSEAESLDVEINASGKLQVLDKILSEIKERGLRVLILFQSIGGAGRNGIGDILDDFLCQRFGQESYERVDSLSSRKQTALDKFNKERRRFVFLIENRACLPSIKLSSVDMLIIFGSDWNPLNDLRALQKISIDSQFEQLKVFRLYSCCSVEEKVLSLAKQNLTLDSNIQNLNHSTNHSLLLWGANFLFHKLDEFHSDCTPSSVSNSKISSEQLFLNDLMQEVLSQLPNGAESKEKENCKIVIKAQRSGASYSKDITLLGEKEMQLMGEELPHILWTNILKERHPQWRYACGPSQRIRRKVQYYDELPEKPQQNAEIVKKRKKVVGSIVDINALKSGLDDKRKLLSVDKEGASGGPTGNGSPILLESTAKTNTVNHSVLDKPETHMVNSEENNNLRESQKSLHLSLKPVISKLCEILLLPDDVKRMAGKILEYMMNNHKIHMTPITLYQAFQISLCWSAASLLNHKIGRKGCKKSLSLAKEHLNFECEEEEARSVYSRVLETLKTQFCHQVDSVELIPAENHSPKGEGNFDPRASQSSLSGQQELEDGEIRETPRSHKCSIQLDSSQEKQAGDSENGSGSSNFGSSKKIKQVEKVHTRRLKKLFEKQEQEFENFAKYKEKIVEKEHADLEVKHKLESALIRRLNSQLSVRLEKLKMLDQDFARKKEEVNIRMEEQQKRLKAMQRIARDKENLLEEHWMQEAKSGRSVATYATLPLSDSGSRQEILEGLEQVIVSHGSSSSGFRVEHMNGCEQGGVIREEATMASSMPFERQDTNEVVSVLPADTLPSVICTTVPEKEFEVVATEPPPLSMQFSERVVEKNTLVSESAADTKSKQQGRLCRSGSSSSSLKPMLIVPLLDQGHTAPAHDGQIQSFQVTVDENAEPAEPDSYDVEVSKCNMSNESQVDIQALWAADAVACNQVNGDTPAVLSDVQLQFSQADSLPNGPTQSDVQAFARVHQEPNVSLQQFEAQIQEQCKDQDAMVVSESNVSNESQVGIQVLQVADAVLCNEVNGDTTIVPFAVQLQLSPVAGTLSNEPSQSDVQACARVDREPNMSLQPFEAQIGAPCEDQDAMIGVELSESNISNESQGEIQVLRAVDGVLSNQVNDDTTTVPSAVQLQLSPVADTLSNEPSQSEVQAYVQADWEPNVSLHSFEAQTRAPYEDHDAMIDEGVSECNVVNESQVEIQALLEVDVVSCNQVIDDTLVVPSAVQLELSPGADTLSTEPTQPNGDTTIVPFAVQLQLSPVAGTLSNEPSQSDVQACERVDQEPNVSLQQFETQRRAPCEDQGPMIDYFGPVPDNHCGHAASEQTQAPTPLPDALSTQHSQLDVSASTCINQEQRNERQTSHQQFETQLQSPVEDQHEPLNHSDTLAGNQFRNAGAAQPEPELPPAMEQSTQDVLNDHPIPLPGSQFTHAHSQQIQDLGPSADPPSTVSSQIEVPTVTCTDQMPRNERQILLKPSEPQRGSTVEDQNELFNHPDPCSSAQVPAQPPSVQQSELLNHSCSRPNAQSRLPVGSSVTGIGSRLSDHRTMSISPDYSPLPPQSAPVAPQVSQQMFLDPLQSELGRIRREEEHTFKMHEEEKMRLSSECEKELEEIRRKYNTMLQKADLEFVMKKKALETIYKIVNLNRSLAEAFRLKCESRTAGSSGQQQGAPPGQMLRSPLQQAAQRPAPVPGPRAAPLPIPPVQMVHQPPALFSSNPIRSHFGQVRTPSGNHQIRTEMRAPAPHLQRFRPTTSMQAPSLSPLSCVLPGQRSLSNPTTASSVHPQRTPPLPTHMPGPFSRTHQSENMAAFRSSHQSSLSALELLMDVERHPSPNPPNLLPPLQDRGQTINTRDAAGLQIAGALREPSVRTGTAADVVYLSDDD